MNFMKVSFKHCFMMHKFLKKEARNPFDFNIINEFIYGINKD